MPAAEAASSTLLGLRWFCILKPITARFNCCKTAKSASAFGAAAILICGGPGLAGALAGEMAFCVVGGICWVASVALVAGLAATGAGFSFWPQPAAKNTTIT